MPSHPYPSELVPDEELEQLLIGLSTRPEAYLPAATVHSVCAYIQGLNEARSGSMLLGLHQWLVVKHKGPNSVNWAWRLISLTRDKVGESASDREAINALITLLTQFMKYRRSAGLTTIFYEYAEWLLSNDWYDGPLRGAQQAAARDRAKRGA